MAKKTKMKKFVVEINLPGAGDLSHAALHAISWTSCHVIDLLDKPFHWIQSFVTDNKIYSIYVAESEDLIREHASLTSTPIHSISEIYEVIDPATRA